MARRKTVLAGIVFYNSINILFRVRYTNGPGGLPKVWIWSVAFQRYTNGPCDLNFVTYLVPDCFQKYRDGP
ncbi:hypothetical protein Hanom_Chr01g00084071 [Helianthus anomalus]